MEKKLAREHKATCLTSLESRRFDKVKVVRETMNRTMELWKEVPSISEEISFPSQSTCSSTDNVDDTNSTPETKRVLFSSILVDKRHKSGGLKSGSRVFPIHGDGNCYSKDVEVSGSTEDLYEDHKDYRDLSLIREQLVQIENQQSSLLDLLQVQYENFDLSLRLPNKSFKPIVKKGFHFLSLFAASCCWLCSRTLPLYLDILPG